MTTICQDTDLTRWEGHDNITFMFFFFFFLLTGKKTCYLYCILFRCHLIIFSCRINFFFFLFQFLYKLRIEKKVVIIFACYYATMGGDSKCKFICSSQVMWISKQTVLLCTIPSIRIVKIKKPIFYF